MLILYCANLLDEERAAYAAAHDEERERCALIPDILTPIAKSWP